MAGETDAMTIADAVVRRLRDHGVRHVFGYPGGQLTPLYDALHREPGIRHVLARDEQAAAFMADGYARATGLPGVCLAVCGPGVLNAATPLATAFTDSIPVLLLSGQVATKGKGLRSGYYHENDQLSACASFTKFRAHVEDPARLIPRIDEAFAQLTSDRPGPVLLEIPVDVLRSEFTISPFPTLPEGLTLTAPRIPETKALAELLAGWKKPLILAGGGIITAGAETLLARVAERLGAPVLTSLNGRCALPSDHPLMMGLTWHRGTSDMTGMEENMSPLFAQADGLIVVGCRLGQVTTGGWSLKMPPNLVHIDIDKAEIGRHYPPTLGIQADAREVLRALLSALPQTNRPGWAPPKTQHEMAKLGGMDLLGALRRATPPDTIFAADVTRLGYMMLAEFPLNRRRTLMHPAGFVPMGYGIPAALGARLAFPERAVVAVVGDGCFLMCGMELATAVQENLPIVVVLVNDSALTLIKAIQERRYGGRFLGVDLHNPDFGLFAKAFGVRHWRVQAEAPFEAALREALASGETCLVEVIVKE